MARRRIRVLVTGAGGFLASALIARLEGRCTLIRLNRGRGGQACDLADPAQARAAVRRARADLVYHLAGSTSAPTFAALWRAHVTATVNLLEALSSFGRPVRVVVAGSSAEYGAAGGRRRVAENALLDPVSAYGTSKLAQSLAALSFSRGPVEVIVARIFNVLGPGTPENLAPGAFARQVARIEAGLQPPEIVTGDLTARRDYLDVRDVAAALEALARRGRPGESYNVGSGRSHPMRETLDGLVAASGLAVRASVDPARRRPSEVKDLAADMRKTARETGFRARIPLTRSLADTLDWWRKR